jgi:hypothetical protein
MQAGFDLHGCVAFVTKNRLELVDACIHAGVDLCCHLAITPPLWAL